MKVIVPGHHYELDDLKASTKYQLMFYCDGTINPEYGDSPGPSSQEVIRALIDRQLFLNVQAPCAENITIIQHLREALKQYEIRAFRRTVEKIADIEGWETNAKGHIFELIG